MTTRFLTGITLALVSPIMLETHPVTLGQNPVSNEPHGAACEREIRKLGAPRLGERFTLPQLTRRVRPAYPTIPGSTTGGGVWIGELLTDALGRVSNVWTIREPKVTPRPQVAEFYIDRIPSLLELSQSLQERAEAVFLDCGGAVRNPSLNLLAFTFGRGLVVSNLVGSLR